jgi:hypothetical protein
VWFEVEVVEAEGVALVGFAGTNFRGSLVGYEDAMSWGIDEDGKPYHGRYTPSPPADPVPASDSFKLPQNFAEPPPLEVKSI